ncbi:MAG: YgaP family membrane protein [Nitrospirota bacterium]
MKKNVGNVERVIRIFAGAAILSLAFVGPQSPWAYLGIIPLATGLLGWCPPYALLGISSCKAGGCGTKTEGTLAAGSSCCGKQ